MINAPMAPIGSKVWILEINESKRFERDELSVGGVFSSHEKALCFLADVVLGDEELFVRIEWKQSAHNTEFFEGVDAEGTEYQIYTTTVDGVKFNVETIPISKKKYIFIESPRHSWLRVSLSELEEFNILEDISPLSYTDGEFAYLEEDMDMGTFLMERQAMAGEPFDWESEIERQNVDNFPHLPNIRPIK